MTLAETDFWPALLLTVQPSLFPLLKSGLVTNRPVTSVHVMLAAGTVADVSSKKMIIK
jgi:hypothetical protein